MDTEELWARLEPVLKRFGVEVASGEPGGCITIPQFPDPGTGTELGYQVWLALDAFKDAPLTADQAGKLSHLLDSIAKVVRYRAMAFPESRNNVFDADAFREELRRWSARKT